jgi:transcriptional regulator with PAS, ATPase and Fis domain
MAEVLDLPAESILGKTDERLFGEKAAAHSRDIDTRVLKGERIEEEYTWIIKRLPLTFLDTRVPMVNENRIVGICGISRNITDRKRQQTVPLLVNQEYRSDTMRGTIEAALLAARRESTILITGESGTGKDHLARFIHDRSPWSGGPFFAINCAAVPSELAESELFGHEVGSFTGANRRKRGLLELAEGGTLLLDEIGEISPSIQAKLLAFVDTKTFTRVGGEKNVTVNARLIGATNRNLLEEVAEGRFRADLFYRLNVFSVHVPPLRDRIEDLPVLVEQVLRQIAAELQLPGLPWIAPDTMKKMKRYSWPGNVRELRNVLERAAILSTGPRLDSDSFNLEERNEDEDSLTFRVAGGQAMEDVVRDLKVFLVNRALRRTGGNKTAAARLLGVSRHSVINYLKQVQH